MQPKICPNTFAYIKSVGLLAKGATFPCYLKHLDVNTGELIAEIMIVSYSSFDHNSKCLQCQTKTKELALLLQSITSRLHMNFEISLTKINITDFFLLFSSHMSVINSPTHENEYCLYRWSL